ncbi:MAG: hypothetical protein A2Y24_02175 [Clostridiales bacterium GWE2_32_10]|nr:MAG: hypothetical protein A2Y24_02175 [Clostridiales bacterium GWE2_32_10]HBY21478.1 hypothetical protein [Clostridiales bacterium]
MEFILIVLILIIAISVDRFYRNEVKKRTEKGEEINKVKLILKAIVIVLAVLIGIIILLFGTCVFCFQTGIFRI